MEKAKFWSIKNEIRVIGVDDAAFKFKEKGSTAVIGVVFRGGDYVEGILKTEITIDGSDATDKIAEMINRSRHRGQLRVIMLNGVTFGGFNVVDIRRLCEATGLPVITATRKLPDRGAILKAIKNCEGWESKKAALESAGELYKVKIRNKRIYIQICGIKIEDAESIIKVCTKRGLIPEAIRVAHLVATAMVKGESSGRA